MPPFKRPLICLAGTCAGIVALAQGSTGYTRILPLRPEEGVFAYARVSPDGSCLSYASEIRVDGVFQRTVNIVELATRKVLFTEPGLDSYWAPDGEHVVYLHMPKVNETSVCIWNRKDGSVDRDVAPASLGHYFTWGQSGGRNLILTMDNHYYYVENGRALRPYRTVPAFPPLGAGEQPMLSKDGRMIATFHRGTILVRGLDEPDPMLETRLRGGKGDFSYDGRYLAFHAVQKGKEADTYQIRVVDLVKKELIHVTDLPGSCYYPSWTRDGRLVFRHDSKDYRGFLMASGFLGNPRTPLPTAYPDDTRQTGTLADLLRRAMPPAKKVVMVNLWAGWCVHCRGELPVLDQLRKDLRSGGCDAEILGACDPTSFPSDREFILRRSRLDLPQVDITSEEVNAFGIQVYPTTLLFVDGRLMEKHHGALNRQEAAALLQKHGVELSKGVR